MAEVQRQVDGVTLLQGIEVDILEDGSLDLSDAVLEILDIVIASPHVKLRQEPAAMTERMMRAVSNPHVDVIGHPTGRRPGSREGASYDFELVFREAAKRGVALEIDCDPARMDPSPEMACLEWLALHVERAADQATQQIGVTPAPRWATIRRALEQAVGKAPSRVYPFAHFTEHAQKLLMVAQAEAEKHGHSYIGTEHLLL